MDLKSWGERESSRAVQHCILCCIKKIICHWVPHVVQLCGGGLIIMLLHVIVVESCVERVERLVGLRNSSVLLCCCTMQICKIQSIKSRK
jgi:hypothetical protein